MTRNTWLIFALALAGVARADAPPADPPEDPVSYMKDEDPAMQKAMTRARQELDEFLKLASSPPAHQDGFAVKVGLPTPEGTEYVWIGDFSVKAGVYSGTINNEVQLTTKWKLGDTYQFRKTDIVDWTYLDQREKRMYGNYTLCALLTQESAEVAADIRKQLKLDCEL